MVGVAPWFVQLEQEFEVQFWFWALLVGSGVLALAPDVAGGVLPAPGQVVPLVLEEFLVLLVE